MRILVVEDNINLRLAIELLLEVHGFHFMSAADGAEALDVEGPIDLLIADLNLPYMNGVALSKRLTARYPACRTLVISGQPPDDGWDLTTVDKWLQKPFSIDQLMEEVEELCGLRVQT